VDILIVHQYFLGKNDAGGSRWNQFAKYWAEQGHKVTILAGMVHYAVGKKQPKYKGKFIVREKESKGVDVLRCHVSESYNKSFIGRFWAYISFTFSTIWAGMFKADKCDVIICTSPPLTVGLTGWILSRLKKTPMVFEVRDLWPESAIDTGVLTNKWLIKLSYWLERKSYSSSSWINVLTPAFKEKLINEKRISSDKISMIPNGADLDIFKPGPINNWVREKHNLGDNFVVTYVGAHGRANHLIQLLHAAKILKEKDPDVKIMLVGDGMEKPILKEKAQEWNMDNVIFIDSVPKDVIVDYVAASNVCTAVLKKVDTFKTVYPNKVFDYMSAKRPVILAIDGVARKLVEDARAGIYVEPENAEYFVEAVLHLKKDPELCNQLGRNGLDFVKNHFNRQELAQDYLRVLNDIIIRKNMKHKNG
jgi:glycosyltransferase involved in cell wall biosynthesis